MHTWESYSFVHLLSPTSDHIQQFSLAVNTYLPVKDVLLCKNILFPHFSCTMSFDLAIVCEHWKRVWEIGNLPL